MKVVLTLPMVLEYQANSVRPRQGHCKLTGLPGTVSFVRVRAPLTSTRMLTLQRPSTTRIYSGENAPRARA